MPDKKLLKIIIPFRNQEKYLEKNLSSLSAAVSGHPDINVTYVDDGSADNSASIVRKYLSDNIHMESVSVSNPYIARNLHGSDAEEEYVAFIDADTILSEVWLKKILIHIRSGSSFIAGPYFADSRRNVLLRLYNEYHAVLMGVKLRKFSGRYFSAYGGNITVKQKIFREMGGFPEDRRGSDLVFTQNFIGRYGAVNAAYDAEAYVTHLEVADAGSLMVKIRTYMAGRSKSADPKYSRQMPLIMHFSAIKIWLRQAKMNWALLPLLMIFLLSDRMLWSMSRPLNPKSC